MKKLTAEFCEYLLKDLQRQSITGCGIGRTQECYLQALEIALPILEQQEREQEQDEWIEWGGGKCPVHGNENVEIKFRDGCIGGGIRKAGGYYWGRTNAALQSDIIAYRIIPEQPTNQNGEQ
ncbi:MAG: hypothetical protein ACJ8LD_19960 [Pantoea agglomerans]